MKNLALLFLLLGFLSCSDETEEPTPTPTLNSEIKPGIGIGDLTFSSTGNDVLEIYGDVEDLTIVNDQFVLWYYDRGLGFQVEEIDLGGLTLQEAFDMRFELVDYSKSIIAMVILPPYDGKTSSGIKLGSPRADVVAVYGEPDNISSFAEDYDELNMRVGYNNSELVDRIDLLK